MQVYPLLKQCFSNKELTASKTRELENLSQKRMNFAPNTAQLKSLLTNLALTHNVAKNFSYNLIRMRKKFERL